MILCVAADPNKSNQIIYILCLIPLHSLHGPSVVWVQLRFASYKIQPEITTTVVVTEARVPVRNVSHFEDWEYRIKASTNFGPPHHHIQFSKTLIGYSRLLASFADILTKKCIMLRIFVMILWNLHAFAYFTGQNHQCSTPLDKARLMYTRTEFGRQRYA